MFAFLEKSMTRKPDQPCSQCGRLLWRSKTSAASPVCRDCQSKARGCTSSYYRGCRCAQCRAANGRWKAANAEIAAVAKAEWREANLEKVRSHWRRWDKKNAPAPVFLSCDHCGSTFRRRGTHNRFCGIACQSRARGNFAVPEAVRTALYERDGYTCQICMEPVESTSHYLSDWYPTLDHIVPRSRGGSDEPANLRTAHRWCNSVRGDERYYTDADLRMA